MDTNQIASFLTVMQANEEIKHQREQYQADRERENQEILERDRETLRFQIEQLGFREGIDGVAGDHPYPRHRSSLQAC